MTRHDHHKQRKRIAKLLDAWTYRLGLRWWHITASYHGRKRFHRGRLTEAFAVVTADWRYLSAHIEVNLPLARDLTDAELERCVVHELCHILVNEMRPAPRCTDGEERVCTTLAAAFLWTRAL